MADIADSAAPVPPIGSGSRDSAAPQEPVPAQPMSWPGREPSDVDAALAPVRVTGGINASFVRDGAKTVVASIAERGGYRLARPSTFAPHLEALQVNTGGGIAGGDMIETRYELGPGADVAHTTSSAERVYRSAGAPARLDIRLTLAPAARLDWLPQQTILYAGAHVQRRIEVHAAADSRLVMVEITAFGRPHSREGLSPVDFNDQWRVHRGGRLVYAEAVRLSGELGETLARPAVAGGGRASALILLLGKDASELVEPLRRALDRSACETGVSTWDGLLAARAIARQPGDLIAALARAIPLLSGRALPRVWAT